MIKIKKALLVAKDLGTIDALKDFFVSYNYLVETAESGTDALQKFERATPDVAVIEIAQQDESELKAIKKIAIMSGDKISLIFITNLVKPEELTSTNPLASYTLQSLSLEALLRLIVAGEGEGDLSEISMPDIPPKGIIRPGVFGGLIVEILAAGFTGIMTLKRDQIFKKIFFESGYPVGIQSSEISETLARMLLREEIINHDQFLTASEKMIETGKKFGETLVEMGAISNEQLYEALIRNNMNKMAEIYSWEKGSYELVLSREFLDHITRMRVNPYRLLLESARKYLNFAEAAEKLADYKDKYMNLNWNGDLDATSLFFNEFELQVIAALEKGASVKEVISKNTARLNELFVFLWFLHQSKLSEYSETPEKKPRKKTAAPKVAKPEPELAASFVNKDELLRDYLNLVDKNHYSILGLQSPSVTPEQIETAYGKMVEKYHPKHFSGVQTQELAEKAALLFKKIRDAYETLVDEQKKAQYDRELATKKKEAFAVIGQRDAEAKFATALCILRKGETTLAEEYLREAIALRPEEPLYYAYLGWTMYKRNGASLNERSFAKVEIEKALNMNSGLAAAHFFLGLIEKEEGEHRKAAHHFNEAVRLDPAHIEALKEFQSLAYEDIRQKDNLGELVKVYFEEE